MLARPMPTSSDRLLLTPATRVASSTKLRLLSGSSWTCVDPIRFCTAAVGWMSCEAAETSTVSDRPPGLSVMSNCSRSLTCRLMVLAVRVWKPERAKATS